MNRTDERHLASRRSPIKGKLGRLDLAGPLSHAFYGHAERLKYLQRRAAAGLPLHPERRVDPR